MEGTTPRNTPLGFNAAHRAQSAVDQADVGHHHRVHRDRHVESAREVGEFMHRPREERHFRSRPAETLLRLRNHAGGEIQRDYCTESERADERGNSGPVPQPRSAIVSVSRFGKASSAVESGLSTPS